MTFPLNRPPLFELLDDAEEKERATTRLNDRAKCLGCAFYCHHLFLYPRVNIFDVKIWAHQLSGKLGRGTFPAVLLIVFVESALTGIVLLLHLAWHSLVYLLSKHPTVLI
jgi:hypothetical protein